MNLIDGLFSGGGLPLLEKSLRFTEARHRRLLDNIANADTPGYRRRDLSAERFDAALRMADRRAVESIRPRGVRGGGEAARPPADPRPPGPGSGRRAAP